ncbi:unnamed protein product [Cuscuta europaea]|uniref:Gnk2-homologous domain-containing protein n=1 Tax=Cuscuta europaea TaxID=41803 RepID=A0A9P0YQJ0_CUSEU|nr:unnamed protein product [Cuscuta europaea]
MLISAGAVQALVIIQMAAYTQRTSNKVYAMAFCRGDIGKATCQSCINNSGLRILLKCPNSLEVVFWDLVCTVRYSNTSMFGVNKEMLVITPTSPAKAQVPTLFNQSLNHLLDNLTFFFSPEGSGGPGVIRAETHSIEFRTLVCLAGIELETSH